MDRTRLEAARDKIKKDLSFAKKWCATSVINAYADALEVIEAEIDYIDGQKTEFCSHDQIPRGTVFCNPRDIPMLEKILVWLGGDQDG